MLPVHHRLRPARGCRAHAHCCTALWTHAGHTCTVHSDAQGAAGCRQWRVDVTGDITHGLGAQVGRAYWPGRMHCGEPLWEYSRSGFARSIILERCIRVLHSTGTDEVPLVEVSRRQDETSLSAQPGSGHSAASPVGGGKAGFSVVLYAGIATPGARSAAQLLTHTACMAPTHRPQHAWHPLTAHSMHGIAQHRAVESTSSHGALSGDAATGWHGERASSTSIAAAASGVNRHLSQENRPTRAQSALHMLFLKVSSPDIDGPPGSALARHPSTPKEMAPESRPTSARMHAGCPHKRCIQQRRH